MVDFMQRLEAIHILKGEIIYAELEDVQTINFIKGGVDLGYDINRVTKFVVRLEGNMQLGAFEMCHNRRSQLIYKASRDSQGSYFMRKKNWIKLKEEYPLFNRLMKQKSILFYIRTIRRAINTNKLEDIANFKERADFGQVVVLD